jgi:hypothetical protein
MKKTILILVAGLLAMQSAYTGYAQSMEKEITNLLPIGSNANMAKVTRHFWRTFGESVNEKWYSIHGGVEAEFLDKNIEYKVVYNSKGDWAYTLKQYTEKELPEEVRDQVKRVYYDYPITYVKEINQWDIINRSELVVYLLHVENDHESKTIRVANGEMNVVETYNKIKGTITN